MNLEKSFVIKFISHYRCLCITNKNLEPDDLRLASLVGTRYIYKNGIHNGFP